MIVEKIIAFYNQSEKNRKPSNPIRLSNAGKCQRQIAYQLFSFPGDPLRARARMLFRLGDLVENDLTSISEVYGLKGMQEEVSVTIGSQTIFGHIDGYLEATDEHPKIVVDFKSCSDFAFRQSITGKIDYSYICQMHAYMRAMGLKQSIIVFYKKQTSHLNEVVIKFDDMIWEKIVRRFKNILSSTRNCLPEREYGPNDKGRLLYPCSYCPYVKICFPDVEVRFDSQNRPQFKVNVKEGEK